MQRRCCSYLGDYRSATRGAGNPSAPHWFGRLFDLQRLDELVEEARNPVGELGSGHLRRKPFGDLESAPLDQVNLVRREEFV